MDVNFKVILKRPDNTQEVRRFGMLDALSTCFMSLQLKLLNLFPELGGKQYRIFWKDFEDDEIVIKNDEELVTALLSLPDNVKKVYVDWKDNVQERPGSSWEIHHGIKCDECDETVKGIRYKCLQCPDYDLCEKCELKHLHPDHMMMKIPNVLPQHLGSCWSRIFSAVDYMTKAMELAGHSRRDRCERCVRKCRGKYRRSCNCNGKDGDGGAGETKDKHEGTAFDKCVKAATIPIVPFFPPDMLSRNCGSESHHDHCVPREIENGIFRTVKFFVDAVRDGFTPKTRSEIGQGEGSEENVKSKSANENEKVKEDKEENEILEMINTKLTEQHVSEKNGEASATTSASSNVDDTEKQPGSSNREKLYPDVPVEKALQSMLEMGFSNEGGTLQKMLEEMDGDIARVLESIDSSLM